jgi:hypothetical protein
MSKISNEKLYELYCDAINRCTSKTTTLSDEEIDYNLFEEFDVAATSFLHEQALQRLLTAGMINEKMMLVSLEVRNLWLELQSHNWLTSEIRVEPKWKHLFSLCDELVRLLNQINGT